MTELMEDPVDPNSLLREIRELLREYPDNAYLAMMLRDRFTLLDGILSTGGPPPDDWLWNTLTPNKDD